MLNVEQDHQTPLPVWKNQAAQKDQKIATRDALQQWRQTAGDLLLSKAEIRANRVENPCHQLDQLKQQIQDLENQVEEYEALLKELPDLFERKFQQRLLPLLERYRLLNHAQNNDAQVDPIRLENHRLLKVPSMLRTRWLGGKGESQQAS
ncbi:MAG: hypothetical protein AB8A35_05805 [Prochlorococcus sp.]